MPLEKFKRKRKPAGSQAAISISPYGRIVFSKTCYQQYLRGYEGVTLFYDSSRRKVGFKPTKLLDADPASFYEIKGVDQGHSAVINCIAFLKHYRLLPDRPVKAKPNWNPETGLLEITLEVSSLLTALMQGAELEMEARWEEALRFYQGLQAKLDSWEMPPETKEETLGHILLHIARILQRQGAMSEAESFYRRAVEQAQDAQNPVLLCNSRMSLATLYRERGEYHDSEKLLQENLTVLREAEEPGSQRALTFTLLEYGRLQRELGHEVQALAKLEQALGILRDQGAEMTNEGEDLTREFYGMLGAIHKERGQIFAQHDELIQALADYQVAGNFYRQGKAAEQVTEVERLIAGLPEK